MSLYNKASKENKKLADDFIKKLKNGTIINRHYIIYNQKGKMKIKYTSMSGVTKDIELNYNDIEGDHWHINEEPFIIYDYEIINGKFDTILHNKEIKDNKEIIVHCIYCKYENFKNQKHGLEPCKKHFYCCKNRDGFCPSYKRKWYKFFK